MNRLYSGTGAMRMMSGSRQSQTMPCIGERIEDAAAAPRAAVHAQAIAGSRALRWPRA